MPASRVRVCQLSRGIHVCLYLLQVGSERSVMLQREEERSWCSSSATAPSPGTVAPGCPCSHSQASFWCLCCWMMDLHEQTPFSGSNYAWSILNLLLFCWSWLLGGRVSLWSPGCLGTLCNPPASSSRVPWFHSAHPFLQLVSQRLQIGLHCLGSWPLLCGYRSSCFPCFVWKWLVCFHSLGLEYCVQVSLGASSKRWVVGVPITIELGCGYIPAEVRP